MEAFTTSAQLGEATLTMAEEEVIAVFRAPAAP